MKQVFFKAIAILSITLLGLGCSSSEEKEDTLVLNQDKISLYKDGKKTLTVSGNSKNVTFSSKNPLIASVSEDGVVTGNVRGTTDITVKSGFNTAVCNVTVNTRINFIDEPILEFGKRANEIKNQLPAGINIQESGNIFAYSKRQGGTDFLYFYEFEGGVMSSCGFRIPILSSSITSVTDFCLERYVPIKKTGTYSIGMVDPEAKYVVVMNMETNSLYIIYAKATNTKSTSEIKNNLIKRIKTKFP